MNRSLCVSCDQSLDDKFRDYGYQKENDAFETFFPALTVHFCSRCGVGQVDHRKIDAGKLEEYYRKTYRSIAQFNESNKEKDYREAYFSARIKGQIRLAEKHLNGRPVRNIFEFGSGQGYSFSEIRKGFPESSLYAHDIDETVERPRYVLKDVQSVKFDIIFMSHVLEHLVRPQESIRQLIPRMAAQGLLVIEVPNQKADSIKETLILEPHITFFSLKSIEKFFSAHFSNELDILQVTTSGSMQASLIKRNERKNAVNFLKNSAPSIFGILKWCYHAMPKPAGSRTPKPHFDFSNDSSEDVYNNIRIVLRKM